MPDDILLSRTAVRKLIGAGSADAALLYLYLSADRPAMEAGKALGMTGDRLRRAGAVLRQLGLLPETRKPIERQIVRFVRLLMPWPPFPCRPAGQVLPPCAYTARLLPLGKASFQ